MSNGQIYKKRGPGGNTGESTFETSEEKTEIPEIDGVMSRIDRKLNETKNVVVKAEETMERGSCRC
jgi:hypothetical protein